jgi:hypothetical protein
VQGLNAHPYYTWTAEATNGTSKTSKQKKQKVMWLQSLLPDDIPNARILTFSYNSNYLRDSPVTDLDTYAERLLEDLKSLRDETVSMVYLNS